MDNYENRGIGLGRILLTGAIVIIVAAIIGCITFVGSCVSTYNQLIDMQEEVSLAEANVETMMQRRLELIPDLVSTVQAYAEHEEKVFEDIANARKELGDSLSSGDLEQISEANENLSVAVNSLVALAENYPDLTSGQQYTSLMDQLEGSVNRITIARESYNEEVANYNKEVRHFPGSILADLFGFEEMEQFEADEAADNPNMVNFD